MSSENGNSHNNNPSNASSANPWSWLGLLKWSLSYSDGTVDRKDVQPLSEEDRLFLEKVMKEGIMDENERMKFILGEATKAMEYYQRLQAHNPQDEIENENDKDNDNNNVDHHHHSTQPTVITEDNLQDLLQELRDIVEQIDYARAFCSLQGLPFLLGCIGERQAVPETIRSACLGILATLAQNNPPVQKQLLELGALKTLSDLRTTTIWRTGTSIHAGKNYASH